MKFVFWLALIALVVMALRSKARAAQVRADRAAHAQRQAAHAQAEAQTMVSCAQCGLYIPAPEAVRADGAEFCCEQHRRQFLG
jgi:uncharacterized protein